LSVRPAHVGLISDTHGLLRPAVAGLFAGVELIVQAGDVGDMAVLDRLEAIAPVVAVFGNVDDRANPRLRPTRHVPVGHLNLRVSHGHELGSPTPARLLDAYADGTIDIIVFGHTHKSVVARERRGDHEILLVNPGAAGPRRFHLPATVALLTVTGRTADVRIVRIDEVGAPSVLAEHLK